jgi:hypothetical protein
MSNVHRVAPGTISNVASNQTTHTENPIMSTEQTPIANALTEAGLSETSRSSYFMSEHVARQVAWSLGNLVGQVCTRIQRLAQNKASVPDEAVPGATAKAELRSMVQRLIWGYEAIGEHMPLVEAKVAEWCGGGYSRAGKPEELEAAAKFLGMSKEDMQKADATRRQSMQDYLTIRRAGLAPVMEAKINALIGSSLEPIEPEAAVVEQACQRAFENRIMFGDWGGAALARDDMSYHCGKTPVMPEQTSSHAEQAARIREQLAEKQAQQAAADAALVADFDPLDIMAA